MCADSPGAVTRRGPFCCVSMRVAGHDTSLGGFVVNLLLHGMIGWFCGLLCLTVDMRLCCHTIRSGILDLPGGVASLFLP